MEATSLIPLRYEAELVDEAHKGGNLHIEPDHCGDAVIRAVATL